MSLPVREPSRSRPFSMNASARTPSHFISTAHSCRPRSGGLPMRGEHRRHPGRQREPLAVDHPVLVVLAAGREQHVAAVQPLAVQDDLDLAVGPLQHLVGAVIPDGDGAAAVLAARDLAVESRVLQRVVLGVHGQVVLRRVVGDALRQRPGDEHPVAFQPEIPVQPARVVLLHHEDARLPACPVGFPLRDRLRRARRVTLAPVFRQPVHSWWVPRPGADLPAVVRGVRASSGWYRCSRAARTPTGPRRGQGR